jgi:hypothetical protein
LLLTEYFLDWNVIIYRSPSFCERLIYEFLLRWSMLISTYRSLNELYFRHNEKLAFVRWVSCEGWEIHNTMKNQETHSRVHIRPTSLSICPYRSILYVPSTAFHTYLWSAWLVVIISHHNKVSSSLDAYILNLDQPGNQGRQLCVWEVLRVDVGIRYEVSGQHAPEVDRIHTYIYEVICAWRRVMIRSASFTIALRVTEGDERGSQYPGL